MPRDILLDPRHLFVGPEDQRAEPMRRLGRQLEDPPPSVARAAPGLLDHEGNRHGLVGEPQPPLLVPLTPEAREMLGLPPIDASPLEKTENP